MIMTNKYENLDKALETNFLNEDHVDVEVVKKDKKIKNKNNENNLNISDDLKDDYEYTRGNLYSIIEKGQEALNGVLELAQETDQPRAYEVAGQLIKNVSDATEKLLELQKKLKDLDENKNKSTKNQTNVTNALFVGSTAELSKLLKNNMFDK